MNVRRILAVLLATLTTLSVSFVVGCGGDTDDGASSSGLDSVVDEALSDVAYVDGDICESDRPHHFAWTKDDLQANNADSLAERVGVCVTCGKQAVLPVVPENQDFTTVQTDDAISEYVPVEAKEGYYKTTIPDSGKFWICFSSQTAGQFVFQSIGGTSATVKRYAAAAIGIAAAYHQIDGFVGGGNFYSFVNRSEEETDGTSWRALYLVSGDAGATVRFRFVRVCAPFWTPKSIVTNVSPSETLEKATKPDGFYELKDVPYDTDYFFDEEEGYYRRGTPANPGEIIYVAITKKANRVFGDGSFISAFETFGGMLYLTDGYTEDGDYNSLCYIPMISNCKDNDPQGGEDKNKNCYENACNADGVYPVTKEMYQFLNLYVRANNPVSISDDDEDYKAEMARDWRAHTNEDGTDADRNKYWLAACFYYQEIVIGEQANPHPLTGGETEITIPAQSYYYVTLPTGTYTLTSNNSALKIFNDTSGETYTDFTSLELTGGVTLRLSLGASGGSVTITLTPVSSDS